MIEKPEQKEVDALELKNQEFNRALEEEERIWKEMDKVFATTPNRGEAEKIVLEQYADQMDSALQNSKRVLAELLELVRKM